LRPPPFPTFSSAGLERAQLGLVAALAAAGQVSIFAGQLLLALAGVVLLARLALRQTRLSATPLDGPVLAFCVWTLLSAAFSREPLVSHEGAKKLVLFALLYLAVDSLADSRARERVLDAVLLGGYVLAIGALLQYYLLGYDTLNQRPTSFLGHYMTASGLLMCLLVLAVARLAFFEGPLPAPAPADLRLLGLVVGGMAVVATLRAADLFAFEGQGLFVAGIAGTAAALALSRSGWPGRSTTASLAVAAAGVASWALLVSRTRNAWLGALAGLAVVAFLRAPKTLWLVPAAVAAVLVARPQPVMERLTVRDASSRDRYFMWQAGLDMVMDKPVFGQGPRMVESAYPDYRWPGAPNPVTPHLHNNVLQIAAERGLPCLAWWLWWVAAAMGDAYRESRRALFGAEPRAADAPRGAAAAAVAALAVLAAVMVGGLFEYNFGDSEVLMLVLIVSSLPYALRRQRCAPLPRG
jgi:O-antigen ligase